VSHWAAPDRRVGAYWFNQSPEILLVTLQKRQTIVPRSFAQTLSRLAATLGLCDSHPMRTAITLILVLLASPTLAEDTPLPNLSRVPNGSLGSAAQLVLAQRTYELALATGDLLPLITAIHLARAITLRPATGWEKTLDQDDTGALAAGPGPDPASEAALTIARNLAGDDPDLQDLVYDLDAQLPGGHSLTAVEARSTLAPGQTDDWRLPLFGEVPAEIGLIGDGAGPLSLTIRDEGNAIVCAGPADPGPTLCRLTPARNGFFTISVVNLGKTPNSYRLIGN
jgi:hypothetical protein